MIFAAIVIICLVGSLSALIIFAPRVYYAMANDGLFLQAVARTHPRFGTPANAIAIQGAIASLLVLLGTFEQIISYAHIHRGLLPGTHRGRDYFCFDPGDRRLNP